jgi:hypothetical protein
MVTRMAKEMGINTDEYNYLMTISGHSLSRQASFEIKFETLSKGMIAPVLSKIEI